jgi:hypothetical protein
MLVKIDENTAHDFDPWKNLYIHYFGNISTFVEYLFCKRLCQEDLVEKMSKYSNEFYPSVKIFTYVIWS